MIQNLIHLCWIDIFCTSIPTELFSNSKKTIPPYTSSTEFSTISTENSISYIRKEVFFLFSKKSFSKPIFNHERLKFNYATYIFDSQKIFRIDEKKKKIGTSDQRYLSIDLSRINGGWVSKRDAKSKWHLRR